MRKTVIATVLKPALSVILLLGLTACKTTNHVSRDNQSGFLHDYSLLLTSERGEANYLYVSRSANWGKYTKVWIKPLELWKSDDPEAPLGKMTPESQQMLMESFYNALYEALTNDFEIVKHGGPDVLVIHAALTDGMPSKPVVDFYTSVYLPVRVASFGKRLLTGTDVGVSAVYVEADLTDGQSGKRVAAVLDSRAGRKALRTRYNNTWGDVKVSFDRWARRFDERLMRFKQRDFGTTNL